MQEFLTIKNLYKSFPKHVRTPEHRLEVLSDINLAVKEGEFVTLFGPNACGKTTLLYTIAGILEINRGVININNRPSQEAKIGYVFQNFKDSLFPWRRTLDNIAFSLEIQGFSKKKSRERAIDLLRELRVDIDVNSYPYELSSGQQQLLSVIRALSYSPDVLLMDEPFNALDFQTRMSMQNQLLRIWRKAKITILFVSHELDEAIYLGDRLVLLSRRPAEIRKIIEINLPRPRKHEIINSAEFIELKKRALLIFTTEVKE